MFPQGPSNTALITAAARALESEDENAIVKDPYAAALAGEEGRALLKEYGEAFVLVETIRTKFFDDAILEAVKGGKRQFITLGAGLDTRPYRMQLPSEIRWFEIDFAPVLEYKRRILKDAKPSVPPIDIYSDVTKLDIQRDLAPKGFDRNRESVWVAEGLLPYLHDGEVDALMRFLSDACAKGSELLTTCPNRKIIEMNKRTAAGRTLARMEAGWIFSGVDKPVEFMARYHFKAEAVFIGHKRAHFGMLPMTPMSIPPQDFPTEWFVKGFKE